MPTDDVRVQRVQRMIEGFQPGPRDAREERAHREKAITALKHMTDAGRTEEVIELVSQALEALRVQHLIGRLPGLKARLEAAFARAYAAGPQGQKGLAAWFVNQRLNGTGKFFGEPQLKPYAPWLGEDGLAEAERIASDLTLDPDADQNRIRQLRVDLAKASGSVDRAVAVLAESIHPYDHAEIAELLWEAGRDDEAEVWVRRVIEEPYYRARMSDLREQLVERLLAAGRGDEAVALFKDEFARYHPSYYRFIDLRRVTQSAGQWEEVRDWALDRVREYLGKSDESLGIDRVVYNTIRILLAEDLLDEAWSVAISAPDSVDRDLWMDLIGMREKDHPADVLEPLATLIETDARRAKGDGQYQKLIAGLRRLRDNCERAGDPAGFGEYLAGLRERRKRKRALMAVLDSAFGNPASGNRDPRSAPDPSGSLFPSTWPKMTRDLTWAIPDSHAPGPEKDARTLLSFLCRQADPSSMSLAECYALGQSIPGLAHSKTAQDLNLTVPEWMSELDPLEIAFTGAALMLELDERHMFAGCCDEWLRMLRATDHWPDVETLVREAVALSHELVLPVNDPRLVLRLTTRLVEAGLHHRKLPPELMARTFLETARSLIGPGPDARLPDPPPGAEQMAAEFWSGLKTTCPTNDGTVHDALQLGLRFVSDLGDNPREQGSMFLLRPLYLTIAGSHDEFSDDLNDRVIAWALGLPADSPLAAVVNVILTAGRQEITIDETLRRLFAVPGFRAPVQEGDRRLHTAPNYALSKVAAELGLDGVPGPGNHS